MTEPSPDRTCDNCDGFSPRGGGDHWHIRRDVPLALSGALIILALAIGSWVWMLSGQASAVTAIDRRVTTLEDRREVMDHEIKDIGAQVGRIEGKLDVVIGALAPRREHQ